MLEFSKKKKEEKSVQVMISNILFVKMEFKNKFIIWQTCVKSAEVLGFDANCNR